MPISEQMFTGFATGAALSGPPLRRRVPDPLAALPRVRADREPGAEAAADDGRPGDGAGRLPRARVSGARLGLAAQHSDHPYSLFAHAGVKTVLPATPADAYGLMLSAIRDDDPVALPRARGRAVRCAASCPTSRTRSRSEAAGSIGTGGDVTVVAVGHLVHDALAVADELAGELSVEVLDPRTLYPFDWELLARSLAAHRPARRVRRLEPHAAASPRRSSPRPPRRCTLVAPPRRVSPAPTRRSRSPSSSSLRRCRAANDSRQLFGVSRGRRHAGDRRADPEDGDVDGRGRHRRGPRRSGRPRRAARRSSSRWSRRRRTTKSKPAHAGTVKEVLVQVGDEANVGDVIVRIEP